MAQLTTKKRNSLKSSQFAGPHRSYPVPDKSHAANAKVRATQAVKAGRMSKSEESRIDAKANRVLGESKGSKASERERHSARHSVGKDEPMLKHTGAKEREHRGREHLKEHRHEPRKEARAHERAGMKRHEAHEKKAKEHERRGMEKKGEHIHHHFHHHIHPGK